MTILLQSILYNTICSRWKIFAVVYKTELHFTGSNYGCIVVSHGRTLFLIGALFLFHWKSFAIVNRSAKNSKLFWIWYLVSIHAYQIKLKSVKLMYHKFTIHNYTNHACSCILNNHMYTNISVYKSRFACIKVCNAWMI